VDLNLDTLKQEVLEYLDSAGFAVFHGHPGGLEGPPVILWDTEHHPDYRMFLEVARKAGVNLVVFATREFEAADLDDLLAQIETASSPAKSAAITSRACASCASSKASPALSIWRSISIPASTSTKCSPTGTKSFSASRTRSHRGWPMKKTWTRASPSAATSRRTS